MPYLFKKKSLFMPMGSERRSLPDICMTHLGIYAICAWAPHPQCNIDKLEAVQSQAALTMHKILHCRSHTARLHSIQQRNDITIDLSYLP